MATLCDGCKRPAGSGARSHRHRTICPGCMTILFNLGYVKDRCPEGHLFTPENTSVQASGYWKCLDCHRKLMREKAREKSARKYAPRTNTEETT